MPGKPGKPLPWTQRRLDNIHVTALKEDADRDRIAAFYREHQDLIEDFLIACLVDVNVAISMVDGYRHRFLRYGKGGTTPASK